MISNVYIQVSLGDRTDEDTEASKALRELMSRHLGAAPTAETSKAYMHFNVSGAAQERLAAAFAEVEPCWDQLDICVYMYVYIGIYV